MTLRLSNRLVLADLSSPKVCPISVFFLETLDIPVSIRLCSVSETYGRSRAAKIFVPEGSDRQLSFNDTNPDIDFGTLSDATFDVWATPSVSSTNQFSKSVGSGINVVSGNSLVVDITNSDTSIPPATYYYELWVTTASSDRILLKFGDFIVENTRKFD